MFFEIIGFLTLFYFTQLLYRLLFRWWVLLRLVVIVLDLDQMWRASGDFKLVLFTSKSLREGQIYALIGLKSLFKGGWEVSKMSEVKLYQNSNDVM